MKAAQSFFSADPDARGRMIELAYRNAAHRVRVMAQEFKALNEMLKTAPGIIESITIPDGRYENEITEYAEASDELTEAMVENAQLLEEFLLTALRHEESTEEN